MDHFRLARRAERVVWCYLALLKHFRVTKPEHVFSFVMDALDERVWGLRRLKEASVYEYLTFVYVATSEYGELLRDQEVRATFKDRVLQDLFDFQQHILRLDPGERELWEGTLVCLGQTFDRVQTLA